MAEKKEVKNNLGGFETTIFVILIFGILGTLLGALGFSFNSNLDEIKLSSAFPTGNIELGENIINKKDVDVHRNPEGAIIGDQDKREVGKVIEGPTETDSRVWWRIDYPDAPDGWVQQNNLSRYVWSYRLLNIFPIIFTSLAPFLYLISLVFLILIIVISVKFNNLENLKQQKIEFRQKKTVKDKIIEESEREEKEDSEENRKNGNDLFAKLPTDENTPKTADVHNRRWAKVETLINSHSVNDWKQAIIEADIILEEMLDKIGYKGNSIGDKLKQVEESDFLTLNQAWEAHKIRNRIAHKGSEYILSRDDAERAYDLYKQVFEEFYLI